MLKNSEDIETKKIKKGQFLLREGEKSSQLYIVKAGRFSVLKNKGGVEREIQVIGEHELIGEMSFIDNSPRSASIRALHDSEVYIIPRSKFDVMFKDLPRWYVALFETITKRLRNTNARIKV